MLGSMGYDLLQLNWTYIVVDAFWNVVIDHVQHTGDVYFEIGQIFKEKNAN